MRSTATVLILFTTLLLAGCGGPGPNADIPEAQPAEETNKDIGNYVVHFSAQPTDQVTADIARTYGITRSKNRAMMIVSVVRKDTNETVPASIEVNASNLTGQRKNISVRPINEQDAIYYIGESTVAHRETLIFDLDITPEGEAAPSNVRFKRQFYTDR